MAINLTDYSLVKLRDGSLEDRMSGAEPDIRQEGVIIALGWLSQHLDKGEPLATWNYKRSLAIALRFAKRRHRRRIDHSPYTLSVRNVPEGTCVHPVHECKQDWSADRMRVMAACAITASKRDNIISDDSAEAAYLVYVQGFSVLAAARHLRVSRGAVYQRLGRAKRALEPVIEQIEVPYDL